MATFFERLGIRPSRPWIRHSFLLPTSELEEKRQEFLTYSTSFYKFTDTRIGGHFALNMPPAFTDFVDLPYRSPALESTGRASSAGMGPYYSEVIDDNSQLIHLQFGFPAPSGLISFFTSFYNSEMSYMAHTGNTPPLGYYAGRAIGFIATLNPGVIALMMTFHTIRFLAMEPSGKYYTLRAAMGTYWMRVNTIANIIAINRGLIQPTFEVTEPTQYKIPDQTDLNNDDARAAFRAQMHEMAPDVFDEDGSINVMNIASRAQRIANKHLDYIDKEMKKAEENGEIDRTIARIKEYIKSRTNSDVEGNTKPNGTAKPGTAEYFDNWSKELIENFAGADKTKMTADSVRAKFALSQDKAAKEEASRLGEIARAETQDEKGYLASFFEWAGKTFDKYVEEWGVQNNDGIMWLTLRVDYTGQHQTSFSNEVGESDIQSRMNEKSQQSREARFSLQDGNTGLALFDGVVDQVKAFATGILDQFQVAGVLALGGSALTDIQKIWKSSSTDLPQATFTIKCRPWSGDPLTVLIQQDMVLAALLAGVLPMSTGPASYTSPMYCSLFSRGKFKISEGIISSLSVSRAVSNVSNTDDWRDLGLDITFTVTDLSSIVHAPITDSFSLSSPINSISNALNNEGAFLDMMSSYSGLTLEDVYYNGRRIHHALNRLTTSIKDRFTVEAQVGLLYGNSSVTRFFTGAFATNSSRSVN